jgi:hypothetical protein
MTKEEKLAKAKAELLLLEAESDNETKVEIPSFVRSIKASVRAAWCPKTPLMPPEAPVLITTTKRRKQLTPTVEDCLIVFTVQGVECQSFASILKSVWDSTFPELKDQLFIDGTTKDSDGNFNLIIRPDAKFGYEKIEQPRNPDFPTRLVMSKR